MNRPTLFTLLALAGCSSTSSSSTPKMTPCDDATGPVPALSGVFKVHYTTQSGNCGDIADTLIDYDSAVDAGCTSTESAGSTKCHFQLTSTCNGSNLVLVANASGDGKVVEGEVSLSNASCAGTYSVVETKQ